MIEKYYMDKEELFVKRDMDLIRNLLIKVEEVYEPGAGSINFSKIRIDGYDDKVIAEHLLLMKEAGLIRNINAKQYVTGSTMLSIGNLTNEGYDTLEKFRNDTVWNKTKEIARDKGLPMLIDIFSQVASTVIAGITEGTLRTL
jgi:hypothetical protein